MVKDHTFALFGFVTLPLGTILVCKLPSSRVATIAALVLVVDYKILLVLQVILNEIKLDKLLFGMVLRANR